MFQYAMARALALRCRAPLSLDTRWYLSKRRTSPSRHYLLDRFRLADGVTEAASYPPFPKLDKLTARNYGIAAQCASLDSRSVALWWRRRRTNYCIEKSHSFDYSAMLQPADAYVIGWWQRFGYFEDAQDAIRCDFQLRHPPNADNQSFLDRIAAADCAVAVHVRRGDLLRPIGGKRGVLSIDYYREAISLIEQRAVSRATLFAFSDDPDWVRSNLRLDREMHVAEHNDEETGAPEDLRLMAACDHLAIANSTLSWWAAYLGAAPGKIVVTPSPWAAYRGRAWWISGPRWQECGRTFAVDCQ